MIDQAYTVIIATSGLCVDAMSVDNEATVTLLATDYRTARESPNCRESDLQRLGDSPSILDGWDPSTVPTDTLAPTRP